jgi:catechol 2,3-dioxygenase-like lactoylglutathione lyase family enzyme
MKATWLLLSVIFPTVAHGQTSPPSIKAAAGAFFALSVADIPASVKWYSEKLGLTVVMEVPKRDGVAVAVLEGGGLIVELIQHDAAVPLSVAAPAVTDRQFVHGLFKVGVVVEDFDRAVATLRAGGVTLVAGPFPARPNQRANVLFRDNAGNLIQFFGN